MTQPVQANDDLDELRSDKRAAFVREYVKDWNATQAAIRAGYSEATAQEQGSRLLSNAMVKAAIERRMAAVAAVAEVDAAMVVRELYEVAMGDPRDLVSLHRGACRFCYGIDHDRQWTMGEYRDALHEGMAADPNAGAPPLRGGTGYDFTREPHPECPECRGLGVERVLVNDTRKLSKAAAKLLASVKQSRDGSIELKTRDQDAALIALGRVCGVFKDRQELSGPGGSPLQVQPVAPAFKTMSDDELKQFLKSKRHPLVLDAGDSQ
jgi:hypothetical protein